MAQGWRPIQTFLLIQTLNKRSTFSWFSNQTTQSGHTDSHPTMQKSQKESIYHIQKSRKTKEMTALIKTPDRTVSKVCPMIRLLCLETLQLFICLIKPVYICILNFSERNFSFRPSHLLLYVVDLSGVGTPCRLWSQLLPLGQESPGSTEKTLHGLG